MSVLFFTSRVKRAAGKTRDKLQVKEYFQSRFFSLVSTNMLTTYHAVIHVGKARDCAGVHAHDGQLGASQNGFFGVFEESEQGRTAFCPVQTAACDAVASRSTLTLYPSAGAVISHTRSLAARSNEPKEDVSTPMMQATNGMASSSNP